MMAVDQFARMMAMDAAQKGDDAYTKAEADALLDGKADLVNGKVPAAQLPSYVDDVVEYASTADFPETGENGKIYIATDTNKTYRWSGSAYVEISESLALGETASTAYAGDKGKENADAISAIKDGATIDSFADVETALANIPQVTVDQTYNDASTNAQAGTAVAQAVSTKVDKITGKGLSENDYTNADKAKLDGIETGAEANVQADWTQTDATADDYIKNKPTIPAAQVNADWDAVSGVSQILNKPTIPTVNDAVLTVQKNGTAVGTFSANAETAATINITVPVDADDVGALPDTTKYGASLALSIDSSTYVVTAALKDQDGNTLGTAQTIDLPLETVVVGGSYDDTTKKVILTLKNGNTIDFSVADLVAGLQTEITSTNKLDADLVDDTTSVHKFVTAADKTAWNAKSDFSGSYNDLTDKPTIPAAVTVDQTYDDTSTNPQSGTAVAQALQDSGSEYSARVMNLEAAYGDPNYLEGLGYWGLVYHTKEYAESGSALSTLSNVTITPGTIILLKWDSADGRGYKDLTYMFSRIGMAVRASDYPSSAGWSVRIVRYETDSQYTNPEPLPDDFDAVIYTSNITYGSSESYSHSIIKAPPMKPGKYYYYAIEFLNDDESASFTCSFNRKVIAYFLQEPSNQPIMYDGVTRQQFIMPKGIKPTDYATQTTGGTIKAWTTTDGSDTILHLATQ